MKKYLGACCVGLIAAFFAITGNLAINQNLTFADTEESLVEITIKNDPATVSATGPEQEEFIPVGKEIPATTITYKNAKEVKVKLYAPDGTLVAEKSFSVSFSPDNSTLTVDWDDVLNAYGKYTIKVSAVGTDGVEVAGDNIIFYYSEKPTVPDTGTLVIFGQEISTSDLISILLSVITISAIALIIVLNKLVKKGVDHE